MTDNTERAQVGWGFWFWWVLASTVGLAGGLVVGFKVGSAVGIVLGGAVFGASLGIAQWLVLRRQVSRPGWWVLASTVGLAGGFAVVEAVREAVGEAVFEALRLDLIYGPAMHIAIVDEALIFAMMLAVGGASVGIAQWLVLRRQVARAGWWMLASTVGGAVGGAMVLVALVVGGVDFMMDDLFMVIILLAVGGAVTLAGYGVMTGGVLVWLLRQPVTQESSLLQDAA